MQYTLLQNSHQPDSTNKTCKQVALSECDYNKQSAGWESSKYWLLLLKTISVDPQWICFSWQHSIWMMRLPIIEGTSATANSWRCTTSRPPRDCTASATVCVFAHLFKHTADKQIQLFHTVCCWVRCDTLPVLFWDPLLYFTIRPAYFC